jgi:transcriptional regulator with XRE-family HTH domain
LIGWRFLGRQVTASDRRAVAAAAVQNELAQRVRAWLGDEGINQEELAKRLGISFSVLNKKLSGEVAFLLPDLLWVRDLGLTLTDVEMAKIEAQAMRQAEYEWRPASAPARHRRPVVRDGLQLRDRCP